MKFLLFSPAPILFGFSLALLASCHFASAPVDPADYVVIAIESNPLQLDPRYATDANSVRLDGLIYNALLRANENLELQPDVALTLEQPDEKTYEVELRRGVRF